MQGNGRDLELQLIDRVKRGERSAFESLVERYKEKAFALAFNMTGSYEDARDVLQEAFIKAYINIKNFKAGSSFYTWFYRILVNLCRDFLRRKSTIRRVLVEPIKLQHEEEKETIDVVDSKPNPAEEALNKEIGDMVDAAINLLPEKQKVAFVLRHIQGLKLSEIASILNCRESTAKVHLFRAVRNLQRSLSPYL